MWVTYPFDTFGAATLHIAVWSPGNGSQRYMGAKLLMKTASFDQAFRQSSGGENRVSVDNDHELHTAQEPGRCICCHGRVNAVCDGRGPLLMDILSACRYLHSSMTASFATSQRRRFLPSPHRLSQVYRMIGVAHYI